MADVSVSPLPFSDAACWQRAIQIHNSKLEDGAASKQYIPLDTIGRHKNAQEQEQQQHAVERSRALREAAEMSHNADVRRKDGRLAETLSQVARATRHYSRAIDVLVQCNPTIAALVWGSIHVFLQIGAEEERISGIASEGLCEIIHHADRWEQVSGASNLLGSERLDELLVGLYVTVLDFLLSSKQWWEKRRLRRIGSAILPSKGDDFEEKLKALKQASDLVDKQLQTESTCKILSSLNGMSADLSEAVGDMIQNFLAQGRQLSDSAARLQLVDELWDAPGSNGAESVTAVVQQLRQLPQALTGAIMDHMQATTDMTRVESWLSLSPMGTSRSGPRTEGTCQWLLNHPTYKEWTTHKEPPVLWITGDQGCGKSVLAEYLHGHLVAKGPNTLFYRFQHSASTTLSTPTSFASSLISQILANPAWRFLVAEGRQQLQYLASQFSQGPQYCSFQTIWDIAESSLKACGAQLTIIIDALDECTFSGGPLKGIPEFFGLLRKTKCRFAVFTRPSALDPLTPQCDLCISMAGALLESDITTFARTRYQQLNLPDADADEVVKIARSSAHWSFRWVDLTFRQLAETSPIADLPSRMRALPPTVAGLYRQSLLDSARRLTQDQWKWLRSLLLMAFQSQRQLKMAEIADALSLSPERVDEIVSDLCGPFASASKGRFCLSHPSVQEFFELCELEDDRSLRISFSTSHDFLTEQCLSCLLGEQYGELGRIRSYLLANYNVHPQVDADAKPREDSFYNYAFHFWVYHLVRTKNPSKRLLRKANTFLLSRQFAYWSEVSRQHCGQLVQVNAAYTSLSTWRRSLPRRWQQLLQLDVYFETSYTLLAVAFKPSTPENPLPWLALMSLGDFYFFRSLTAKVASTRGQVLAGLSRCLGPRHSLTLTAKSGVAFVRLYDGRMRAGNRMYSEIVAAQREIAGEQSPHYLDAVAFLGQSELFMGDFTAAAVTLIKLSADCLTALGLDDWRYLAARWWHAQAMAYKGHLKEALECIHSVVQKRYKLYGPGDSFGLVAQATLGNVQLLLGRHGQAIAALEDTVAWRRETYPPSNAPRIDSELALATAYRAAGQPDDASRLLMEIEDGVGHLRSRFERYCQLTHLRAFLLADAGRVDEAIDLLQDIITQAEEDQNNRALLWIRLDLATLLRRRDRHGDRDQASANYDNLARDVSGECDPGFPDEPDPPRVLDIAERALILIREAKHAEARDLLKAEQLEWRRPSDFWLWVGGHVCTDLIQIEYAEK
ncbi:hypothetical protein B0H67DRAFT_679478 [Lasiosphaeris hirsuta]|uniref:NACHT domain-containing protein n=1 Tax=Lasiosphaeris hirsuta TaxID=260670 RepID=A0AA40BCV8_9PEZI|nr:hypothetical protein B0H67DRAFT_679478 [Lasiosphaeris hirsuta]